MLVRIKLHIFKSLVLSSEIFNKTSSHSQSICFPQISISDTDPFQLHFYRVLNTKPLTSHCFSPIYFNIKKERKKLLLRDSRSKLPLLFTYCLTLYHCYFQNIFNLAITTVQLNCHIFFPFNHWFPIFTQLRFRKPNLIS